MKRNWVFICAFLFSLQPAQGQNPVADGLEQKLSVAAEDTSRVLLLADISFEYTNNQADSALYYGRQSLALAHRLEFKRGEAIATRTYARGLSTLGNFAKAIELDLKALRMFEELKDEPQVALTDGLLADTYRDAGDYGHALSYSLKANDFFRDSDKKIADFAVGSFRKIALALTASIYERSGIFDSALWYARKAYALDEKETGGRYGWLQLQFGKIQADMRHPD